MVSNSKSREELQKEINELKLENGLLKAKIKDAKNYNNLESCNLFKNLTEITSTIYIVYQDDRIVYFNNAATTLLGYSEKDFFQKKFSDFIHPGFKKIEKANRHLLINGEKENISCELKLIKKNGSDSWFNFTCHRFEWSNKPAFIGVAYDIHKRKVIEEELLKFKLCIERSFEAIFITDKDGHIIFINPAFEQMYGFSPIEATGKTPRILKSGTLSEDVYNYFWKTLLSKKAAAGEIINKTKDGKLITIEGYNTAILDSKGEIYGFIGIHRDISVQKKQEEELKKSEEEYRLLFANNPQPMWIYDLETLDFLEVNEAAVIHYGYSKDKFLSMNLKDIRPEEDIPNLLEDIKNTRAELNDAGEWRHRKKNGEIIDVEIISHSVLFADRKARHVLINDITKRKRVENELLKLSHAVEQSPVSIIITDLKGNMQYVNPTLLEITGYAKEELIGKNPRIFNSNEKPKEEYQKLWETITSGKNWFGEFRNKKKNGELYWESVSISPIIDEKRAIINYVAVKEDVTERKKFIDDLKNAKEKAEENEDKLTTLIGNLPGLVYSSNSKWETDFINDSHNISGYSEEDFLTKRINWMDLIHEDDRQMVFEQGAILLKKKTSIIQEYRIVAKDKTVIHVSDYKTSVFSIDNKFVGVEGVVFDITEKNKQKEELVLAKEKAEESDRLKSAFLANMSHEIRTPMNGILGFTSLLLEPELSDETKDTYIQIIHQSGERMLNTVTDIVEISKIEAGIVEVKNSMINFNESTDNILMFFQPQAQKKGLTLSFDSKFQETNLFINSDKNKFESILTNLIKNAIKYTDKGKITVSNSIKDGYIEFCIRDTGIGILKNRKEAIFNRFEQADIADSRAFEGSGLGLAIAKSYVEMLGGKIWVESIEGEGSQFYFNLPYSPEKNESIINSALENRKELNLLGQLKILVVEDDETSALFLNTLLKDIAQQIIQVSNGKHAIEKCKSIVDFDLILMDIKMPELNGYETTQQIRQFNKDVVIIAQTAFGLSGDKEKAINAGCNDYISKPINKEKLKELIQKYFKL